MEQDSNFSVQSQNNIAIFNKHLFNTIKKFNIRNNVLEIVYENGYVNLSFDNEIINLNFYNYKDQIRNFFHCNFDANKIATTNILGNEIYNIIKHRNNLEIIIFNNGTIQVMHKSKLILSFFDIATINDEQITLKINNDLNYHFYGFGQKPGFILNKNHSKISMWSTNNFISHHEIQQELSLAINFHIVKIENKYYGIFINNASRIEYNMLAKTHYTITCDINSLDLYLFIGETIQDILKQYFYLTGTSHLPPKYSLVHQKFQNNFYSTKEVRDFCNNFHYKQLPLTAVYLDSLYMNNHHLFSYDNENFGDIKNLIIELRENKIELVPIISPAIAIENKHFLDGNKNDVFVKNSDGSVTTDLMWPGKCSFIDYFNPDILQWWEKKLSYYTRLGFRSIWCDMNQPTTLGLSKTLSLKSIHKTAIGKAIHQEVHNLYGYYQVKITYKALKKLLKNLRPFILTKSGFAGIQKYATIWVGDSYSYWWQLKQNIVMGINLSLSGIVHWGIDIGNFIENDSFELLIRWYQLSILFPFLRSQYTHNEKNQNLIFLEKPYTDIIQKVLCFRNRLLPHLYTLSYLSTKEGSMIVQPLFWFFSEDESTYHINDQYMVGSQIMVAPILEENKDKRMVYFPKGQWIDYNSQKIYSNGYHLVNLALDSLPIFIYRSSIIISCINNYDSVNNYQQLNINVYLDNDNFATPSWFYDDDGLTFNYKNKQFIYCQFAYIKGKVNIINKSGNYIPNYPIKVFIYKTKLIDSYDLKWLE